MDMISSIPPVLPLVAASVGFQGKLCGSAVATLIFTQGSLQCVAISLDNFQHTFAQTKPENCTLEDIHCGLRSDYIVDFAGTLHDPPLWMAAQRQSTELKVFSTFPVDGQSCPQVLHCSHYSQAASQWSAFTEPIPKRLVIDRRKYLKHIWKLFDWEQHLFDWIWHLHLSQSKYIHMFAELTLINDCVRTHPCRV